MITPSSVVASSQVGSILLWWDSRHKTGSTLRHLLRLLMEHAIFISKALRCAVSVPYASSRYELSRAFSIPRRKCFRAGLFWRKSLKRNGERGRNRTFNLLIKSQGILNDVLFRIPF